MKVLLTGGAGFIGSCILGMLNDMGAENTIVVDNINTTEKWKYLAPKRYCEYVHKDEMLNRIDNIDGITHVIHIGACSATTESNFDYLYSNNFEYSKSLWQYCARRQISFIYASTAATYGMGEHGFSDKVDIEKLLPLNGYGYSKQLFDLWVQKQVVRPSQVVGLKFFNVYGPNEYHKQSMASVVFHGYNQVKKNGEIRLFQSHNPEYADGGQLRDFVYVKDICSIMRFFLKNPGVNGLYNVGTGKAASFASLAQAVFRALALPENITYIPMPEHLREKYQYFTEASMQKLRQVGYTTPFTTIDEGVKDYVCNYLDKGMKVL